jgi:hypothetical protein
MRHIVFTFAVCAGLLMTLAAAARSKTASTATMSRTLKETASHTITTPTQGIQPNVPDVGAPSLPNVSCPFSRWQGEPRYCYECRWCPFRESTCCEMEDEIDVLKSVNVSGSADWDCFITIVHFQQCGRCDPAARKYIMSGNLNWVWSQFNASIRPCRQACKYIHKQCRDAVTLKGERVVPSGMSDAEFCDRFPVSDSPETPCYNAASTASVLAVMLAATMAAVFF